MGGRSTGMVRLLRSVVAASLDLLVFLLQLHSTLYDLLAFYLLLHSTLVVVAV